MNENGFNNSKRDTTSQITAAEMWVPRERLGELIIRFGTRIRCTIREIND